MEYKRFNNKIVARIDKGEEILAQLNSICVKEGISLASVSAIGASNDFTVGVFKPENKQYIPCNFKGDFEIVSLTGTVTAKDGKPYIHLHMSAAGEDGSMVGGHLNSAMISVTCEMVIDVIDGTAERRLDDVIGINLIKFD